MVKPLSDTVLTDYKKVPNRPNYQRINKYVCSICKRRFNNIHIDAFSRRKTVVEQLRLLSYRRTWTPTQATVDPFCTIKMTIQ